MKVTSISFGFALAAGINATPVAKRATGTATVSLASPLGNPEHLASGFIYGIPDNDGEVSTQIPDHFYTDIGFTYCRAGGAQLGEPNRGWAWGEAEYPGRFQSALSNYRTARRFGGKFILLVHDMWGADSLLPDEIPYPGDDGDWTSYDNFLTQVISDLRENDMLEGLELDIWNEPDGDNFWNRPDDQYLELWGRAYQRFRNELADVPITGPSLANPPDPDQPLWVSWTSFVSENNSVPDIYSWHQLSQDSDPAVTIGHFNDFREENSLPEKPININEYGASEGEQMPSVSAWYISRFERLNMNGLRANWGSADGLHDFHGNLLGKSDDGTYFPNGDWQVYKYYGTSMTGERVETTGSEDGAFDVYATAAETSDSVKILASTRGTTDTYDVTVTGLDAVGLPNSGTVGIQTLRFDWEGIDGQVGDPVDMGIAEHNITGGQVTFSVTPDTAETAYAFEFQ